MQNVASNIRNAHGILHKFKYVFPHIILFLYNNIAIPPKEYVKRNVQYQLLEFMSKFDEDLLQRAETFNLNSFVQKNLTYFINQYEVNCRRENDYVCPLVYI